MKAIALFISLTISISCSFSGNKQFSGVFNDISPDELKIMYSCKNAVNEAYSDGAIYVYDILSNKKIEIAKIKNLDYNLKSYFITNDTILIVTDNKISLYDIKAKKEIQIIAQYRNTEYIVSSKKEDDRFYFTVIDNNNSKLKLINLKIENFEIEKIQSVNINIIPTDNFFEFFVVQSDIYYLDNGDLKKLKNNQSELISKDILFNDEYGNYIIASTKNTICFIKKNQLIIKSLSDNSLKTINIPSLIDSNAWIETIRSSKNQFILYTGSKSFIINDNATYIKSSFQKIYNKNNILIKKTGTYKFELSYNSI